MSDKALLICQECLSRNYDVKKTDKTKGRMEIRKFCKKCNKHTIHKESK
jgi:large subunit ribosomal protein L33